MSEEIEAGKEVEELVYFDEEVKEVDGEVEESSEEKSDEGSEEVKEEGVEEVKEEDKEGGEEVEVPKHTKKPGGYKRKIAKLEEELFSAYERLQELEKAKVEAPDILQYEDMAQYYRDLAEHTVNEKLAAAQQKAVVEHFNSINRSREVRLEEEVSQVLAQDAEIAKLIQETPAEQYPVSDAMKDYMADSDDIAGIYKYLVRNPALCQKIAGLSEAKAIKELAKIEAQLEFEKKAAKAKSITKAPQPASKPKQVVASSDDDFLFF